VTFQEEAEFNEAEAARKTAEAFGTQHLEVPITAADFLKEILQKPLAAVIACSAVTNRVNTGGPAQD
jgi:asparagine synthetase B (glutamine-hydrolysing)